MWLEREQLGKWRGRREGYGERLERGEAGERRGWRERLEGGLRWRQRDPEGTQVPVQKLRPRLDGLLSQATISILYHKGFSIRWFLLHFISIKLLRGNCSSWQSIYESGWSLFWWCCDSDYASISSAPLSKAARVPWVGRLERERRLERGGWRERRLEREREVEGEEEGESEEEGEREVESGEKREWREKGGRR